MDISQFLYPLLCWWTFRLLPNFCLLQWPSLHLCLALSNCKNPDLLVSSSSMSRTQSKNRCENMGSEEESQTKALFRCRFNSPIELSISWNCLSSQVTGTVATLQTAGPAQQASDHQSLLLTPSSTMTAKEMLVLPHARPHTSCEDWHLPCPHQQRGSNTQRKKSVTLSSVSWQVEWALYYLQWNNSPLSEMDSVHWEHT